MYSERSIFKTFWHSRHGKLFEHTECNGAGAGAVLVIVLVLVLVMV